MLQAVGRVAVAQQHNREVIGRLLHLSVPALSGVEQTVLDHLSMLAENRLEATQQSIKDLLGADSHSTATGIINRLIAAGCVEHVLGFPIQRGMWLRIVATGQQTAEPKCTSPHWRYRKEAVPSPAIHQIRERNITLARMIEDKARELGKPISEYLMDCVYVGHHEIAAGD